MDSHCDILEALRQGLHLNDFMAAAKTDQLYTSAVSRRSARAFSMRSRPGAPLRRRRGGVGV